MFLNWITQAVKTAVLKGFREAVEELDVKTEDDNQLAALKQRFGANTLAPAPVEEKKTRKNAA